MAYQNFYATKLQGAITDTDDTIEVQTPPSVTAGRLVLEPRNPAKREIISFTGVSGTQMTGVTRGEGGTAATSHNSGVLVEMNLTAEDIQDIYDAFASFTADTSSWRDIVTVPSVQSVLGNRSYTLRYTGVDYSSTLGKGIRMRIPRTGTTPTQSFDFESSSSQYASKSSPSGLSFTDDFTCEAWIKVESITGSVQHIFGRRNAGVEGWELAVTANGQIRIFGQRIANNFRFATSHRAVPVGRWIHIAATLDMSGNTGTIYFNGAADTVVMTTTGTATALVQGTSDFTVGRTGTTGEYFDGQVADIRVWSAIRTASQIRDNMDKQLVGNETNLVAYYKGGDFNDSTSNANHLTGSGGASATFASHPFNATEYGIVTGVVYSGGNTDVTVYTGQTNTIPNSTLGDTSYSSSRAPIGFNADRSNWRIVYAEATNNTGLATGSNFMQMAIPAGAWLASYDAKIAVTENGSNNARAHVGLSSVSGGSVNDDSITGMSMSDVTSGINTSLQGSSYFAFDTAGTLYLVGTNVSLSAAVDQNFGYSYLMAECAYV